MCIVYMLWFTFILGLNFSFLLFWGMTMYGNEFETKEINIQTKNKLEPQHICVEKSNCRQ